MSYIDPALPLLICLFALGLNRRIVRWCGNRSYLSIVAVVCLFLWSWLPVALLTSVTLERWHPVSLYPAGDAEVIVVLAGGLRDPYPSEPQASVEQGTYLRTRHAAWLHKHWKALPVLASGGPIGRAPDRLVVSDLMKELLVAEGVPAETVWTERQSLTTHENAVYTSRLLRQRGINKVALVTQGYHMPRAERCFRKQGLEVVPAPCSYQHLVPMDDWMDYLPRTTAMRFNDAVLHEWVGLTWYWLRGWI